MYRAARKQSLLVDRAILKSKPHVARNAVALCYLCRVAIGNGLALLRPQHEEAVRHAFTVAHRHGFSRRYRGLKQTRQQRNQSDHNDDGLWHRSLCVLNVGLADLPVNLVRVTRVSYTDFGVQAPRKYSKASAPQHGPTAIGLSIFSLVGRKRTSSATPQDVR